MRNLAAKNSEQHEAQVLSRACVRAADLLGLTRQQLAQVIGVSNASISRMAKQSWLLSPSAKSWELALLFVRLFRSLDALMGSDDTASRDWLSQPNRHLGGVPGELIQSAVGLVETVTYLDAMRAKV